MKDVSGEIAKSLLRTTNKDDEDSLSRWKNISEKHVSFLKTLQMYWNMPVDEMPDSSLPLARKRLLVRMNAEVDKQAGRSLFHHFVRAAAVIFILFSVGGLSVYINNKINSMPGNGNFEVSTRAGQQSKVVLPDGSHVWLNAETELKYKFEKKERQVSLSGEAYFEVMHDEKHPFVVEAGRSTIKVLGTSFNVAHYAGSKITETALLNGKIIMAVPDENEEILLKPGQKVTYDAQNHLLITKPVEVQKEILWRNGVLVFENESFGHLVQRLERYYAVRFIYEKEKFRDIHYTGTLDNLSIDKVLDFINLTIPLNYEIENKTIILKLPESTK